jgi:glycerol-3-phosphate acyltransferase PlsY
MYPPWLGFKGGKGVATAAGVFAVLAPLALAVAALVFLAAVALSRYVSVGSLAGAVALATSTFAMDVPGHTAAGSLIAAALITHRHRENLARLLRGSERRVGLRL